MKKRLDKALEKALEKASDLFWQSISESFPEVRTGDFGPDDSLAYEAAIRRAVAAWLMWNLPTEEGSEAARQILRETL